MHVIPDSVFKHNSILPLQEYFILVGIKLIIALEPISLLLLSQCQDWGSTNKQTALSISNYKLKIHISKYPTPYLFLRWLEEIKKKNRSNEINFIATK